MPDLLQTLQGHDLGFLRMTAAAWGFDLDAPDAKTALPLLVDAIRDARLAKEVVESLPDESQTALQTLVENDARMLWAAFTRRFGEIRPFGPARRDRERPDLNPVSTAEVLWYRALIGKAFFNLPPAEPQEYAYIADDLRDLLPVFPAEAPQAPGRPASPAETSQVQPASTRILDDSCTLLAALRMGIKESEVESNWLVPASHLRTLLEAAGLLDTSGKPIPENVRSFLEIPRPEAMLHLADAWQQSSLFNELRLIPEITCEGEWENNPLQARKTILDQISLTPADTWWNINSFLTGIKEQIPDFLRPAGDYDSWFIRRKSDGVFLRGFVSWEEVEGRYLRYLLTGPLHWLGMLDLTGSLSGQAEAFRFSKWGVDLWNHTSPKGLPEENGKLHLTTSGHLRLQPGFPRPARYLLARFCLWGGEKDGEYRYRINPGSLQRAREQGLNTGHLLVLLKKHGAHPLPPPLLSALERWEKFGPQASLENVNLLRLATPDLMNALRKSKAARFLGEALNPTTVIVKPGGEDAIQAALAELGHLADF